MLETLTVASPHREIQNSKGMCPAPHAKLQRHEYDTLSLWESFGPVIELDRMPI